MNFFTLRLKNGVLEALDQTRLPHQKVILRLRSSEDVISAIKRLSLRGAPAIGVAGAYGLALASEEIREKDFERFLKQFVIKAERIASARPTAVNLRWAVTRVLAQALKRSLSVESLRKVVYQEAINIHREDKELCLAIGRSGLSLIKQGDGILTHCNAGALATGGIGTALAPLYLAKQKGIRFHVYVDETRPLLQGARLTAWELDQAKIPHTLICDNMAASLMAKGSIKKVLTGADRIAKNGDTANKIGTYGLAVLAKHHDIPFYIAAPSSTFDPHTKTGRDIPIEERESREVRGFGTSQWVSSRIPVHNPAFDVTPHRLVSGFITDKGLLRAPYTKSLKKIFV